jgi:hypothetical protein
MGSGKDLEGIGLHHILFARFAEAIKEAVSLVKDSAL